MGYSVRVRELLLYVPTRDPCDWTSIISPGQYAVFLTDVESSAPVRADGRLAESSADHFCLLFDSLAEADRYCNESVEKNPRLKCEVFDSEGRINAPVAVFVNSAYEHMLDTEARARRLIVWGLVLSIAALPFFAYAFWAGASVVWWPILVGINLFFAGLRLVHWGHGAKEELKYQREQASRRLAKLQSAAK